MTGKAAWLGREANCWNDLMSVPLVDVLIPAYNVAATIRESVESIQKQTVGDIRIIVVDDGSTDATGEVLAGMQASDQRIQVIRQANGGIVSALNAGLAACRARLVARHDGDDLAAPDRFERQIAYLDAHPDCIAVSGLARHIDQDGNELGTIADPGDPGSADAASLPAQEPYLMHPFLMTYRSALEKVGGYRYAYHAEDSDLYWRLQELGALQNIRAVLGSYRIHAGSITGTSVLNGRISALYSQLAAIAARRRRAGRRDLVFERSAIQQLTQARSLPGIFEVGAAGLEADERAWLRVALATKLLELASYRPYELDEQDCRFIRAALSAPLASASAQDLRRIRQMWPGTAARLAASRRFREAVALAPPKLYPKIALYSAVRVGLPRSLHHALRRALGRPSFYK